MATSEVEVWICVHGGTDGDGLSLGADDQGDVELQALAGEESCAVKALGLEGGLCDGDVVSADGDIGEDINAGGVGLLGADKAGGRVGGGDGGVRDGGAGGVGYRAADASGGLRVERRGGGQEEKESERKAEETAQRHSHGCCLSGEEERVRGDAGAGGGEIDHARSAEVAIFWLQYDFKAISTGRVAERPAESGALGLEPVMTASRKFLVWAASRSWVDLKTTGSPSAGV